MLLAAAAGLILCASGAGASIIVVRSVGPVARIYAVGRTLPDTVSFNLRQGESVTVLGLGGTRIFRGPGRFSPANPVRPGPRGETRRPQGARLGGIMMSSIDRPTPRTRSRIGAVAGGLIGRPDPARPAEPPTIWDVDPNWTGAVCLRVDQTTRLVRPAEPAPIEITAADGVSRRLAWEGSARFAAWPGDLPIADGASFDVNAEGWPGPRRIVFRLLRDVREAVASGDPVALADAFIAQGCTAQLERLVEATLVDETD